MKPGVLLSLLLCFLSAHLGWGQTSEGAQVVVVYNESDPESGLIARFYAEQRGVPEEQVVGLACPDTEEISRAEYDIAIADPLREIFTSRGWWQLREPGHAMGPVVSNRIRYIVLIRGMPLKIAAIGGYPGDRPNGPEPVGSRNEASVDSELATLGLRNKVISGALKNPLFRSAARFADAPQIGIMLVTRLDGPSGAVVRRMIVDSIAAEKRGLAGFCYLDARGLPEGEGLQEGDRWMLEIAQAARRAGSPVMLDNGPSMYPDGYPLKRAALYFGWYTEHATQMFAIPAARFEQGAVAVHIHSFSGSTVRNAQLHWVAPLLNAGAAATVGNVYEPYLTLTPHLDVLHDRLRSGFNFAEAAYMSQRVLSWMTTVVGDPLYQPFPPGAGRAPAPKGGVGAEWEAYAEGAQLWFKDRAAGEAALLKAAKRLKSGVIYEGYGLLQLTVDARAKAIEAFAQARSSYKIETDIQRVMIHEIIALMNAGQQEAARALAEKGIAAFPKSPAVAVFRIFAPEEPKPAG